MRPERAPVALLALAMLVAGAAAAKDKAAKAPVLLSSSGRNEIVLAQSSLQGGNLAAAEKHAQAALASDPGSPLPHATMGLVRAAQKKNDKAQAEFNRALALAPNDGAVWNAYGSFLCSTGDREGADNAFRTALQDKRYTTPAQALVNAGRCALIGKDFVRADGYLRRAIALAPTSRPILLMLAEVQLQMARPLEARAFVERSDALGPDALTLAMAVRAEDAAGDAVASARYRKRLKEEFPNYSPTAEGGRKQ